MKKQKNTIKTLYKLNLLLVLLISCLATILISGDIVSAKNDGGKDYCNASFLRSQGFGGGRYDTASRLCKSAWTNGYNQPSSSAPGQPCKNRPVVKDAKPIPTKPFANDGKDPKPLLTGACHDGAVQGKKDKASSSPSGGGSTGGGGGGSEESAPGNAGDLGGDNKTEDDGDTEDGITVDGKDISASVIKLDSNDTPGTLKKATPTQFVTGVLNIVYSLAASIAVIVIVAAGVMYVVSDGDPARTTRAKNAIIYSAVGLVITGSAFVITGIIQGIGAS